MSMERNGGCIVAILGAIAVILLIWWLAPLILLIGGEMLYHRHVMGGSSNFTVVEVHKKDYYPDEILMYERDGEIERFYRRDGSLKRVEEKGKIIETYDITGKLLEENSGDSTYILDEENIPKKESGEQKIYTVDGELLYDYNYKNWKLDGIQKSYFYNSPQLRFEKEYQEGTPVGIHRYFYKNGDIEREIDFNFENGNITTEYFIGGQKSEIIDTSKKNQKEMTVYYTNGNLKENIIEVYSEGMEKLEKIIVEYEENGERISKEHHWLEKGISEKTDFYKNGNAKSMEYIKNYMKLPVEKSFYENGSPKSKSYYDKESGNFISEEFYENGSLSVKTIYNGRDSYNEVLYHIEYDINGEKYYEMIRKEEEVVEKFYLGEKEPVYERVLPKEEVEETFQEFQGNTYIRDMVEKTILSY